MRWLLLLAVLGVSACTMPLGTSGLVPTGARARVEVLIPDSTADDPAAHGAPAGRPFEIVLTNTGTRPLWVTASMSYEGPSPTQGVVELSGPFGRLEQACMACKGPTPEYRVLRPGEQQHMKASLACFGELFEPGVYAIRATFSPSLAAQTYRVGFNHEVPRRTAPPPPPTGVDPLTEDVVSEVAHFRILARDP